MHILSSYPMLASTATTFMLSLIFIMLSQQSGKQYMRLWGGSWLLCSVMFLLDFLNLSIDMSQTAYVTLRQFFSLYEAYLFLFGTFSFFQLKTPYYFNLLTALSTFFILLNPVSQDLYTLLMIPNIIYCSGLLIIAACLFISMSWTQKLPEKMLASFLIILWSIFINYFGFTLDNSVLALSSYFIGLLTVNILMLELIIIYFKKMRFLDTKHSSRFRLLVENSSDSMFLYDYKTRSFEYISSGVSALIGVSDAQLYDMPERFFDYISVEEKNVEIINIFSKPVTKPGNGVLCLYKNDEIIKWSEIHYQPIRDATNTVIAVEGIMRDISERKKMELDLITSADNRKELLENISHEIKTPITLIQGYTELLLDKMVPVESTETYLKMINSKAKMLTTLLDDLTQASHVDSQVMEYRFYEQNAEEFFTEMMDHSRFQILSSDHIPVISSNISSQAIVIADPYRLQQVISNMINNACRHTPEGGEIHISCHTFFHEELLHIPEKTDDLSVPDGELIFLVSDRGDGISDEHMPYIFERNYSEGKKINPNVTADYEKGKSNSGLGLYISKQIITQHSGRMFAKNNVHGGADVSFTLPYYKA